MSYLSGRMPAGPITRRKWKASETRLVIAEWKAKRSATEIAEQIGCTRNMIIGKVWRLYKTHPELRRKA